MAKAPEAEPVGDGKDDGQQDSALGDRVAALETGQGELSGKLDQVIGMLGGGGGEGHEADPTAGGAPTIAHEIRQQLEERDRKNAAEQAERGKEDRLAAAEAKLAELAEKPPADLPTRRARIMGWS